MLDKNKGKVILYLVRHGQTVLNKANKVQGWYDGKLTYKGIEDALNVGAGLSNVKFKAFYSSDLRRAVKTAEIIIDQNKVSNNLKLNKLHQLREVHFGKYEGKLESRMVGDISEYLKLNSLKEVFDKYFFQRQFCDACAALDETKQAEDYLTVLNRVMKILNDICKKHCDESDENILIVIHGGIIRVIIDYIDKNFNISKIDNLSVSKIVYENGIFKVVSVNDNSYNEKGKILRISNGVSCYGKEK